MHHKMILVLDDESEVPALVEERFKDQPVTVRHFETAAKFEEFLDGDEFVEENSIALIDIALGRDREAGFAAAHHLIDREIYIPIIFISESSLTSSISRSAQAGSHAYLRKDRLRRDAAELDAAIAQAEGARLRQEEARLSKLNQWGNRAVVLAGALGHDIETVISPMLVEAVALKIATEAAELDRQIILAAANHIIEHIEHAQDLLKTAFNFVSGKSDVLVRRDVDLVEVIRDIVALHGSGNPPIQFFACKPRMVNADPTRVQQMVFNLINNAQKYAADGKQIDVSIRPEGAFVNVAVRDYGMTKLSRQEVRRIWRPLIRGYNAEGTEGGGYGLTIVKEFALMHGGEHYHATPGDGEHGNIFGFKLPLITP